MTILIVHVTESMRELVAHLLSQVPVWAVLYHSEPDPADPLSTVVDGMGLVAVPIVWRRTGVVLDNATDLIFPGVSDPAAWIGIVADRAGSTLLAYGEIDPTPGTGTGKDWFTVSTGRIQLVVA